MFVNEKAENKSESSQVIKSNISKMTNRYKKCVKALCFSFNLLSQIWWISDHGTIQYAEDNM